MHETTSRQGVSWWVVAAVCAGIALIAPASTVGGQSAAGGQVWVGSWATAASVRVETSPADDRTTGPAGQLSTPSGELPPVVARVAPAQSLVVAAQSPARIFGRTIRQVAHLSLGGAHLRVVFTNALGTAPIAIAAVHVGVRDGDASMVASSMRAVTFAGKPGVTLAEGAVAISDQVSLIVADLSDLVVDAFVPEPESGPLPALTVHAASWQTNFVSRPGNFSGATTFPVETTTAYRRTDGLITASSFLLARVEVDAPAGTGAIVTLGDSITDGTHSGLDTNNRWPDHLARRLVASGLRMGVLNAGIGGNRLLRDGNGPNALARFDRDVLAQPGVTHVVVLEGINDIGQGRERSEPSAADLIAGHQQLIARAHARGLRVIGVTMTPFEGAGYWTRAGESKRQAFNDWVRTANAYDAVFDFDAVVRDPAQPTKARPEFDPGDHLHLTAAGYRAVAESIDLSVFRR